MRKVTVAKSVRLVRGQPMALAGQVIEVDEATFDRLAPLGVFADESVETDPEPVPVAEVAQPEEPAPEDEPAPPSKKERVRPLKDAPIADWRDYAKQAGINPSGLKKAEIIGAVYESEGTEY